MHSKIKRHLISLRSQGGPLEVNFSGRKFKFAETISNDMGMNYWKQSGSEHFIYALIWRRYIHEDLENSLKIKQNTTALNFIMRVYEDAIIDLTNSINIERNNKPALKYWAKAYYLMEK